ncbi:MAG: haloacid dehalogenase type II [Trueperaceae bacterium]|nr:haloacid dehalogenase type II [Trueperaceae bacterium]
MRHIVFDVNETLLDLSNLNPQFKRIFGEESVSDRWFAQLLQNAMVASLSGHYQDFADLARDALELSAKKQGFSLRSEDAADILAGMRRLSPHSDVIPALTRLKEAGFCLIALTNSPYRILKSQLSYAGILDFFEQTFSVDEVKLFKPHPAVYQMAAQKLGIALSDIRMVAAHNWDITGAIRAGCKGAFVARAGAHLGTYDEKPDIVASSLIEVAEAIIQKDA